MASTRFRIIWLLCSVLSVLFCTYTVWSYSLTDPNLVLTSWGPYWQAQQWLWQKVYAVPQLQANLFIVILSALWLVYGLLTHLTFKWFPTTVIQLKHWVAIAAVVAPVVLAYNALSHDVFNYIFNARMVIDYGVNPHVQTALQFASDPWTRFMHNTHTVAPYGYGWTALSLIGYVFGFGYFTMTWAVFKGMAALSVVGLAASYTWLSQSILKQPLRLSTTMAVFLNPLLVLELLGNAHNDLWMIVPALVAFGVALHWGTKRLALLLGLFFASIMIKYVTIVLLPLFIVILYAENSWERMRRRVIARLPLRFVVSVVERLIGERVRANIVGYAATGAAFLLLLPLCTSRSQLFHPWYLLWAFAWLPFISVRLVRIFLISFSVSSTFRYVPWLAAGGFMHDTLVQQQMITWFGGMVLMLIWIAIDTVQTRHKRGFMQQLQIL